VERNYGTHQDRLIKKMRRQGISSYEAANAYLEQEYLPQHNRRFARPPAQAEDYHGRKPSRHELREVFRLESLRSISNDWVVRNGVPRPAKPEPTTSRNIEGRFLSALIKGEPEAREAWAAIAQYNHFLVEHRELYHQAEPVARIALISAEPRNVMADEFLKQ